MKTIVLCTGGFDPLHSGHIKLFSDASALGDKLVVGINSDEWLTRKKGRPFMPFSERAEIIKNLKMVDHFISFDDTYGSANDAIHLTKGLFPNHKIIFANGGDRNHSNIPEMQAYENDERVEFVFGLGGDYKSNSSSWILGEWESPRTLRPWGYYRTLHSDGPGTRVKELTVNPGKSLSMQRHRHRNEYWMCSHGQATVKLSEDSPESYYTVTMKKHDELHIPVGTWHQLINETSKDLRIVEIQYGENCIEEDIERVDVDKDYGASLYE